MGKKSHYKIYINIINIRLLDGLYGEYALFG